AQLGATILIEATLSFLGLGVPEPHPSWGRMLSESAAEYVRTAPWLVIFPGMAISLVVFGTNLFGDSPRALLDPRQRRESPHQPWVRSLIVSRRKGGMSLMANNEMMIDRAAAPAYALTKAAEHAGTAIDIKGLQTYLFTRSGIVKAVDDVSFSLQRGET